MVVMTTYNQWVELEAKFDSHKSFYGKAHFTMFGGWGQNVMLRSYDTVVAVCGYLNRERAKELGIDTSFGEPYVCELMPEWDYSATTLRHVREFLRQFGFGDWRKREIERYAIEIEDGCYLIERP